MANRISSLAEILAPMDEAEFFEDYFGKNPCILRAPKTNSPGSWIGRPSLI